MLNWSADNSRHSVLSAHCMSTWQLGRFWPVGWTTKRCAPKQGQLLESPSESDAGMFCSAVLSDASCPANLCKANARRVPLRMATVACFRYLFPWVIVPHNARIPEQSVFQGPFADNQSLFADFQTSYGGRFSS